MEAPSLGGSQLRPARGATPSPGAKKSAQRLPEGGFALGRNSREAPGLGLRQRLGRFKSRPVESVLEGLNELLAPPPSGNVSEVSALREGLVDVPWREDRTSRLTQT